MRRADSVVVAAPHSYCVSPLFRDCDRVVERVVEELEREDRGRCIAGVHRADQMRFLGDYNRDETYWSRWRRGLRDLVVKSGASFLLEVHSFPANERDWAGADIVLFRSAFNAGWIGEFAREVRGFAPELDVRVVDAGDANSILFEFAPQMPHVLAEFNESWKNGKRAVAAVYNAVAEFLHRTMPADMSNSSLQHIFNVVALLVAVVLLLLVVYMALNGLQSLFFRRQGYRRA